ncbi:endophilin-B1-like isoform X1 [Leucoraja erinacea]|uniref:endophilin-B1-like isoform X1 n=1 Tax=Leucoraja erinaceus TaxID=7782 RepID=UPI002455AE5C|nr:endophilin-B1-like isoform X1 [Leucoraja erinacea]
MDFNVKKLAADAGTFLSRAVQFTEEKFGQAEKTELDAHLENLLSKAESTKLWTEKIMKQTEVLLQPNPNTRIEEFVYEKLDRKVPSRINNSEQLGQYMLDAGNEFGPGTAYGSALIKCGENENRIGAAERELIHTAAVNFLSPLRNFLEGDYKTISKERKLLQNKRLDLDAAKARLRKAKVSESRSAQLNATQAEGDNLMVNLSYMLNLLHVKWLKNCLAVSLPCGYGKAALDRGLPQIQLPLALASFTLWAEEVTNAEQEVRITQSDFDRQAEITRLLLEGISSTHAHHLRCLHEYVDAQVTYYAQCYQYMVDLQKQLGSFPTSFTSNNNQIASAPVSSNTVPPFSASSVPLSTLNNPIAATGTTDYKMSSSGTRKARVLYDYDAADSSELSLLADEVITVYSLPGMDSDWLMSERGNQKGKVPITYLELLN